MAKLSIIVMLFISVCATAKTKHQSLLNGVTVSIDTIEESTLPLTKEESYELYLNDCNTIVKDTIRQSGYISFDTIRVSSIPEDRIYLNKPVIKSVQLSGENAIIIVADTIWNEMEAPEYRSTWEYYVLAKNPMPESNTINSDYSNKNIVFRMTVYSWKKRKPLSSVEWDKYINNKNYSGSE